MSKVFAPLSLVFLSLLVSLFLGEISLRSFHRQWRKRAHDLIPYPMNYYWARDLKLRKKEAGEFRIAVLGDSIAYGMGVEREEAFPAQLEKLFQQKYPGGGAIKVINLGAVGRNLADMNAFVENDLGSFQPDLVLLLVNTNDLEFFVWNLHPYRYCPNFYGIHRAFLSLMEHSLLAYRIYDRFGRNARFLPASVDLDYKHDPFFACAKGKLEKSLQWMKMNRVPYVPMVYYSHHLNPVLCKASPQEVSRLKSFAEQILPGQNPLLLNKAIPCSGKGTPSPSYFLGDNYHLNSRGNRLLAEYLFHFLNLDLELNLKDLVKGL